MMSSDQQASSPPPASEPALLSEAPRVAPAASERRASNKQQSTGASGSGTGSTRTSLACVVARNTLNPVSPRSLPCPPRPHPHSTLAATFGCSALTMLSGRSPD